MNSPNSIKNTLWALAIVSTLSTPVIAQAQDTKTKINSIEISHGNDINPFNGATLDDGLTANFKARINAQINGNPLFVRLNTDILTNGILWVRTDYWEVAALGQISRFQNPVFGDIQINAGLWFWVQWNLWGKAIQNRIHSITGNNGNSTRYTWGYTLSPFAIGEAAFKKDLAQLWNTNFYSFWGVHWQFSFNQNGKSNAWISLGLWVKRDINAYYIKNVALEAWVVWEYTKWPKNSATQQLVNNTSHAFGKVMIDLNNGLGVFGKVTHWGNFGKKWDTGFEWWVNYKF